MQQSEARTFALALEGLFRVFRSAATAGELSLPAASVLGRLARDGAQRLTELAIGERVSQPAMTQLVGRLERDGLARKARDRSDARAVLVEITARGRRVVEQRREQRATYLRGLSNSLDAADVVALQAAIPALERLTRLSDTAYDIEVTA